MKYLGMTVLAAGLALTGAYFYGMQSVQWAEAGSSSCTYSVDGVTGPKKMHAYTALMLDAASPSGAAATSVIPVLSIDVSALDAGCEDVTLKGLMAIMTTTDNAGTHWNRTTAMAGLLVMDHDSGDIVATGAVGRILGNEVRFNVTGDVLIESGETMTLDFYVDATYASEELDDMLRMDVKESSFSWSDSLRTIREMNAEITGNTLTF